MNSRESPPRDKKAESSLEEAVNDLQEEAADIWEKGRILVKRFTELSESLLSLKSDPRFSPIFDKKASGSKKASIVIRKMLGL